MEKFRLTWKDHLSMFQNVFRKLLQNEMYVDVTLSCQKKLIKCHKIVLSACSSYFESLLTSSDCPHPIILITNVAYDEMLDLINFMYYGEVTVEEHRLDSLLRTAEILEIKGLGCSTTEETPPKPKDRKTDYSETAKAAHNLFQGYETESDGEHHVRSDPANKKRKRAKKHQVHVEASDAKKNKHLFDFFEKSAIKDENNPNALPGNISAPIREEIVPGSSVTAVLGVSDKKSGSDVIEPTPRHENSSEFEDNDSASDLSSYLGSPDDFESDLLELSDVIDLESKKRKKRDGDGNRKKNDKKSINNGGNSKKFYSQSFSEKWTKDPLLRDWLVPDPIDGTKAYCKYCCKVLKGSKTHMLRHANRGPESSHAKAMKVRKEF